MCYVQISDRDNPRIVLHKVRIRALRGQSPDCQSARPRITIVVHVYVNWLVFACWKMAHREALENGTKKPF